MKKVLVLLFAVIMMNLSTGCNSKKVLNCSMTKNQSGIEMNQNIKMTFNANNVENFTVTVDAILGEEYKNYKSLFISTLESSFERYKNLQGVDIKTTDNDNTITIALNADVNKMDDDAKKALDIVDTRGSFSETKKSLENSGYTCK